MSGPSSGRRRVERGEISWVTLLLLALVASGGYLGWIWVPVYFDDYTVKQVVTDYANQAIKNPDDQALRRDMVTKIRSLAQVDTVDDYGRTLRVPAIPLEERAVTWERDAGRQPPTLRIAFEYERTVVYPFLHRTGVKVFTFDKTHDLSLPDWGPAR